VDGVDVGEVLIVMESPLSQRKTSEISADIERVGLKPTQNRLRKFEYCSPSFPEIRINIGPCSEKPMGENPKCA
jgi:hypothetical protein